MAASAASGVGADWFTCFSACGIGNTVARNWLAKFRDGKRVAGGIRRARDRRHRRLDCSPAMASRTSKVQARSIRETLTVLRDLGRIVAGAGRGGRFYDTDFANLVPKAQFLYGLDVSEYMGQTRTKLIDLQRIDEEWRGAAEKSIESIRHRRELMDWFVEQASAGCRAKFAPYLGLQ